MADRLTADDLELLRSEGFWLTMTSGHADTVRRLLAERDRYRDAIRKMHGFVLALEAEHFEAADENWCESCGATDSPWPCSTRMQLDEALDVLAAAFTEGADRD